jgi:glutamate/tyrosine decarboxylase-like PLP-dependent enzyme
METRVDPLRAEAKPLPERGAGADEVLATLSTLRERDARWRDGRVFCLVFHGGEEIESLLQRAHVLYFSENGLNPTAFPSLRKMETEVVSMVASLLGGDEQTVGNLTTGGTESILMAVKAAREWGRARGIREPEMVLPRSAHPAFDKAAHYFGVRPVRIPVAADHRADVEAARRAISRRTVLLVGSAPSYPQGVLDPIEELARLAWERGLLCHVDACVGGMMLPFVRELGHAVPPFDLRVRGVTSISADLHKYGYAAKGASVILYRSPELRRHQYFAYTDWPGGIYVSPTMTGTRSGGAIAAAWAVMHHLGREGYRAIAREVMAATRAIRDGVARIDGLEVLGDPVMSVLSIGARELDIYEVGDALSERGWHLDRQQHPASLHLTVNRAHVPAVASFLADLGEAAAAASRKPALDRLVDRSRLALAGAVARVLPGTLVSRLTAAAGARFRFEGSSAPKRSAALYGMMAALPNRGDLATLAVDLLDRMTRPDVDEVGAR